MISDEERTTIILSIRRRYVKIFLDIITMAILSKGETWGYDIIAHIHTKYDVMLSPGTIYPALRKMEKKGWVFTKMGLAKRERTKLWCLTDKGTLVLHTLLRELADLKLR